MSIDIDAENGIVLPDEGPGNRERFAAIFRHVWAAVLPEHKATVLAYWAKFKNTPLIDLVTGHRFPGENEDYGCRIKFNVQTIDWAPDDMVARLIAHELGHVWGYSNPNSKTTKATFRPKPERDKIKEDEADELAEAWGFGMAELRAWGNHNLAKFQEFGCEIPEGFTY